jgi:hypothetical protein
MILRELFYFDKETLETVDDTTYDPASDESPVDYDDTRKTRLTLSQINKIRKASEFHKEEQEKELVFVRQMYGIQSNAEAGV